MKLSDWSRSEIEEGQSVEKWLLQALRQSKAGSISSEVGTLARIEHLLQSPSGTPAGSIVLSPISSSVSFLESSASSAVQPDLDDSS